MQKIILFIENDTNFLNTQSQILELEDFHVLKAPTLESAERQLKEKHIHLAIFDVRMIDDNDSDDKSGLIMALKKEYRNVPKILLTGYPEWEYVRDVLRPARNGHRPALDFLAKDGKPQHLIQAVNKAFQENVGIDWDLIIRPSLSANSSCTDFAKGILPPEDVSFIAERASELEDLFRKLFYASKEITIDKELWPRPNDHLISVSVIIDTCNGKSESNCVILGLNNSETEKTLSAYKTSDDASTIDIKETIHFVGITFPLAAEK